MSAFVFRIEKSKVGSLARYRRSWQYNQRQPGAGKGNKQTSWQAEVQVAVIRLVKQEPSTKIAVL